MKTKLGISVGLLGAATYFVGLFSGYTVLALFVGYILLFEENIWLKRTAVKAFAINILFSLVSAVVGLIPNVIYLIDDLVNIFGGSFSILFVTRLITFIQSALSLILKLLMLGLGLTALSQGTIKFPIIDKLIDKHMSE